jgi:hypothetical protein
MTNDPATRWRITFLSLGLATLFTAVQWLMFAANCLFGIFGVPVMVCWCLIVHWRKLPNNIHGFVACTLGAACSYVPMAATLIGVKLWPG